MDNRLLLTPTEAAEALAIGRTRIYALIASGELPSVRLGASVRVPAEGLREWVQRQIAGQESAREQVAVG